MTKPSWLKKKISFKEIRGMKSELRTHGLHTVCEEARCPNASECFSKGIATVMIMGDVCTRSCKFCNVKTGKPDDLDSAEPENVAKLVKERKYKHVVITSVDRDDLKDDFGSKHYASVVRSVKEKNPNTSIEVLTPDFQGREDCLDRVCQEEISIFNHNIETNERLTPLVRSVAKYDRSLKVLKYVKERFPNLYTISGMMLGMGETKKEVIQTMKDLRENKCQIFSLGQYLQPTKNHYPVKDYIHPDQFQEYKKIGKEMGFEAVFAGPFVRSSYLAGDLLEKISSS